MIKLKDRVRYIGNDIPGHNIKNGLEFTACAIQEDVIHSNERTIEYRGIWINEKYLEVVRSPALSVGDNVFIKECNKDKSGFTGNILGPYIANELYWEEDLDRLRNESNTLYIGAEEYYPFFRYGKEFTSVNVVASFEGVGAAKCKCDIITLVNKGCQCGGI